MCMKDEPYMSYAIDPDKDQRRISSTSKDSFTFTIPFQISIK